MILSRTFAYINALGFSNFSLLASSTPSFTHPVKESEHSVTYQDPSLIHLDLWDSTDIHNRDNHG